MYIHAEKKRSREREREREKVAFPLQLINVKSEREKKRYFRFCLTIGFDKIINKLMFILPRVNVFNIQFESYLIDTFISRHMRADIRDRHKRFEFHLFTYFTM